MRLRMRLENSEIVDESNQNTSIYLADNNLENFIINKNENEKENEKED
jgi:hypothetical protein